jgi:hypothetical protein
LTNVSVVTTVLAMQHRHRWRGRVRRWFQISTGR